MLQRRKINTAHGAGPVPANHFCSAVRGDAPVPPIEFHPPPSSSPRHVFGSPFNSRWQAGTRQDDPVGVAAGVRHTYPSPCQCRSLVAVPDTGPPLFHSSANWLAMCLPFLSWSPLAGSRQIVGSRDRRRGRHGATARHVCLPRRYGLRAAQ